MALDTFRSLEQVGFQSAKSKHPPSLRSRLRLASARQGRAYAERCSALRVKPAVTALPVLGWIAGFIGLDWGFIGLHWAVPEKFFS